MAQTRFTCTLTKADEAPCQSCARVTIIDAEGATALGCPRHALAALDGITRGRVDWPDSKDLNEWERKKRWNWLKNEASSGASTTTAGRYQVRRGCVI